MLHVLMLYFYFVLQICKSLRRLSISPNPFLPQKVIDQ